MRFFSPIKSYFHEIAFTVLHQVVLGLGFSINKYLALRFKKVIQSKHNYILKALYAMIADRPGGL